MKTKALPTKATPIAKAEPVAEAPAQRDPTQWIGLDVNANGTYDYVEDPAPHGRDRAFIREGRWFEVCAVDADGCWLYRYSPV